MSTNDLVVVSPHLPPVLPLIPLENPPVYPGLVSSLHVPRGMSIYAIEQALNDRHMVGLLLPKHKLKSLPPPKEASESTPEVFYSEADLFQRGVSVRILKKIVMPDGTMTVLVHGIQRFEVFEVLQQAPFVSGKVHYFEDSNLKDSEVEALARSVILQVKQLSETNPFFTEEMKIAMLNTPHAGGLADLVAFALSLKGKDAQGYIETVDVRERFLKLLVYLRREQDLSELQKKISSDVDARVNKFQREFFLKEQLKSIKKELGLEEDDKSREGKSLRKKIAKANLPPHALKIANEELDRLQVIPEMSPEFNVTRNYIDWIASLPWSQASKDNLNLAHARKVLDNDHFGLEKVKERILEFLAVKNLKPDSKGSILCFVGPPGVGKTSLGRSIATSLGREFYRFSVGGMRDEAEIKGHRRTYVGALPGKILQGLKRVGKNNPVVLLDEIDKMGASFQGDPASALLEVLDPEQNSGFVDHYLDIPFDLSHVMFIATANSLQTIPPALLDRMEVIELPGYTLEEKEKIATRYIIPRALDKSGLAKEDIKIPNRTLDRILKDYAREPGVRGLQHQVERICRRAARLKVEAPKARRKNAKREPIVLHEKDLQDWLGPQRFYNAMAVRAEQPGVMTGLAWTAMGGDILFVEALAIEGKGELKITGQLGEVMTESARIALSHVKKYLLDQKNMRLPSGDREISPQKWFATHDIHLHVPAGAVPKDGPSAGVTMASALLSLATGRKSRAKTAMTGELSLVGKVLPVGGIKEKVLAAKRAGITTIVLPKLNEKDLSEVPTEQRRGLEFHFAEKVGDVFEQVLRKY